MTTSGESADQQNDKLFRYLKKVAVELDCGNTNNAQPSRWRW
ncbi:hypothetical protein [Mycobacterium marinum]